MVLLARPCLCTSVDVQATPPSRGLAGEMYRESHTFHGGKGRSPLKTKGLGMEKIESFSLLFLCWGRDHRLKAKVLPKV